MGCYYHITVVTVITSLITSHSHHSQRTPLTFFLVVESVRNDTTCGSERMISSRNGRHRNSTEERRTAYSENSIGEAFTTLLKPKVEPRWWSCQ